MAESGTDQASKFQTTRDKDRGPDPRQAVARTLHFIARWEDQQPYFAVAEAVINAKPDDRLCAFCDEEDCELGCPMSRWRGQD